MITYARMGAMGRLGNQMFQYAAMRAVEARRGFEPVIPPSLPLDALAIDCRRAVGPGMPTGHYREATLAYDERLFAIADGTDITGYFQSERYVAPVAERMRAEFVLRKRSAEVDSVVERLRRGGRPTVSVHVRRGDYLRVSHVHPGCSAAYYRGALALLKLARPAILVCSDDLPWCRASLSALRDFGEVVFSPLTEPAHDLAAMMACDHHVVANSSFAWWSAWLGESGGQVVAPSRWYAAGTREAREAVDTVPRRWLRVDNATGVAVAGARPPR